ncbi:glycolate oxidase subunit GlcE [Herminiimonas sp. CN]|uniref:glycolate oxidase subunit GlcE n=1 Tax=Herminiimonas sp. CN TaxID=1349818 RepID=UPI0004733173|nr:glycolate oxidase subunit GlcE [Herminiimonas sp. CN]
MEHVLQHFIQQVQDAASGKTALRIRGGGSKDWYGQAVAGAVLDTRAYSGILGYDPTELVITARCGTPLAEIEAALAAENQMLAFEPPHFGPGATIGGVFASGLSGPRRAAAGAVRDFALGAVLLDGRGEVLRFGGQVMKNVAGYDVSRLLAGSMGTLGLILQVSLKVLPQPFAETTLRFGLDQAQAIARLNAWAGQPLPISASAWHDGVLTLRLSGARAAVSAAQHKLGGEPVADKDAERFWNALREQSADFFADTDSGVDQKQAALWRLSVPGVSPPLLEDYGQLIEWGGAQRWLKTDASASTAATVRAAAVRAGGHATLFRGGDKALGVFQPLAPAIDQIHRNLKSAFDPDAIFNPGRMFGHL